MQQFFITGHIGFCTNETLGNGSLQTLAFVQQIMYCPRKSALQQQ
jgi:hypothetical protein